MRSVLVKLLTPIASLKLTVVVLGLLTLLIFFSTLAQTTRGIGWVIREYYESWYVWVPVSIFGPPTAEPAPWGFLFPGGATLGTLILVNLLAAHTLRFKLRASGGRLVWGLVVTLAGAALIVWFHISGVTQDLTAATSLFGTLAIGLVVYAPAVTAMVLLFAKRAGIVMIHLSLILLIAGEMVTRNASLETMMPIYEGETINWSQKMDEAELVVIDPSDPQRDRVIAIREATLVNAEATGRPIQHPGLPFDVQVERFLRNTGFREVPAGMPVPDDLLGLAREYIPQRLPEATGVGQQTLNSPGILLRLSRDGKPLGRVVASAVTTWMGDHHKTIRQDIEVDGKTWQIDMRYRRYYKPYAVELVDFKHDLYPGTNVPKNFSSQVVLHDPTSDSPTSDHLIWMNHPMRYDGATFFQAQFIQDDRGTVLQVVRNPASPIPYIACTLGGLGLLLHFSLSLQKFLWRELR